MSILLKDNFEEFLITTLYPVTEKLGNSNAIITNSAWTTIQLISINCSYTSVPELIAKNTDYLIDTIIHHLRHLEEYPNTPQIMKGILIYADETILLVLEDTLDSIFNTLDEYSNSEYTLSFIYILHSILDVLYKRALANNVQFEKNKTNILPLILKILDKTQFFMGVCIYRLDLMI